MSFIKEQTFLTGLCNSHQLIIVNTIDFNPVIINPADGCLLFHPELNCCPDCHPRFERGFPSHNIPPAPDRAAIAQARAHSMALARARRQESIEEQSSSAPVQSQRTHNPNRARITVKRWPSAYASKQHRPSMHPSNQHRPSMHPSKPEQHRPTRMQAQDHSPKRGSISLVGTRNISECPKCKKVVQRYEDSDCQVCQYYQSLHDANVDHPQFSGNHLKTRPRKKKTGRRKQIMKRTATKKKKNLRRNVDGFFNIENKSYIIKTFFIISCKFFCVVKTCVRIKALAPPKTIFLSSENKNKEYFLSVLLT
jgi:hypothetical protein